MKRALLLAALTAALTAGPGEARAAQELAAVAAEVTPAIFLVEVEGDDGNKARGTCFRACGSEFLVTTNHILKEGSRVLVKKGLQDPGVEVKAVVAMDEWDLAALEVPPGGLAGRNHCLKVDEGAQLPPGTDVAYSGFGFGTDLSFLPVLSTYRSVVASSLNLEGGGVEAHAYNLGSLVISGLSGSPLYMPESGVVVGVVNRHYGPKGMGLGFGGAVSAEALRELIRRAGEAGEKEAPEP